MGRLVVEPGLFAGEIPPYRCILQVLLDQRLKILHSCRRGLCGQDMIRIRSGMEFLNPVGELERDTLSLFNVANEPIRMACCTRVVGDGEVVIEIVQ